MALLGALVAETGIGSADLAGRGLLHLIPALLLRGLEELGLGLVALVEQLEKFVSKLHVDTLRGEGVIVALIFFSVRIRSVIRSWSFMVIPSFLFQVAKQTIIVLPVLIGILLKAGLQIFLGALLSCLLILAIEGLFKIELVGQGGQLLGG